MAANQLDSAEKALQKARKDVARGEGADAIIETTSIDTTIIVYAQCWVSTTGKLRELKK